MTTMCACKSHLYSEQEDCSMLLLIFGFQKPARNFLWCLTVLPEVPVYTETEKGLIYGPASRYIFWFFISQAQGSP